jgi:hypothetical protein
MTSQYKACCLEIKNDVDNVIIIQNLKVIEAARNQIYKLADKFVKLKL